MSSVKVLAGSARYAGRSSLRTGLLGVIRTTAAEQRRRHEADRAGRHAHGRAVPDLDEAFLAALAAGHPPAVGIALGVDRMIALVLGAVGVLGALVGIVGCWQALEAIKLLAGIGEPMAGRLLILDGLGGEADRVEVKRRSSCEICGDHPTIDHLIDYEVFCGLS